ncbi:Endonuclease III-like protein 1 [Armadillidium nasatum]|uniref:Endonuclease III homolog n=1 Tax=Armadillidium nasatum TaxID=96803 RepID=A0A5N5SHN3_9CRUS|nr:Endonuclease III-like protein 1 [Armadillidium nasatum]
MVNQKWEPPHWKEVYEAILEMRSKRDAAVDQMGAEKCSDADTLPEVRRFHTLIGLMLSSQTKDAVTHAAVMRLREHGLTVENILNTPVDRLKSLIYPVGFYKKKAEYIVRTCQILKEKYNCDIPETVKELCALPGVGVDTHVHRISNRLGWTRRNTKTPEETRKELEDWLPKDYWREANLLLVGFGQQICLPLKPNCSNCIAQQFCPYGKKAKNSTSHILFF